jgi:ADP-ribose pyrophosphatase
MVKQFRYPHQKVTTEIPAGKLEWGENHLECGKRELHEETGCTADEFTYLGCLVPTPAYDSEIIHMYLAKGLHKDKQKLDEDEFLEVYTIPLSKAVEMVMNNEIEDAKTQLALLKASRLLNI